MQISGILYPAARQTASMRVRNVTLAMWVQFQVNAARSTGPKSAEGKAIVARNALKHGLAGHGVVLPDEMAEQIQQRKEFFWKALKPDGPMQQWMFERICIESVRADSCLHQLIALRDEAATRASESWDDDRTLEAEELGAKLSGKPALVQPKLLQSKHGALWLVAQWEELERRWDVLGRWTEAASDRAMDLLGLPVDGRDGVWQALSTHEDGGDGVRDLIRGESGAIRARLDGYLDDRDARAFSDAIAGLGADGPDVRRVLRYERKTLGRLRGWTRELRRLQDPGSGRAVRDDRAPDGPEGPPTGPPDLGPFGPERPEDATAGDDEPEAAPDLPRRDGPLIAAIRNTLGHSSRSIAAPSRLAASPMPRPNRRSRRAQAAQARRDGRS